MRHLVLLGLAAAACGLPAGASFGPDCDDFLVGAWRQAAARDPVVLILNEDGTGERMQGAARQSLRWTADAGDAADQCVLTPLQADRAPAAAAATITVVDGETIVYDAIGRFNRL